MVPYIDIFLIYGIWNYRPQLRMFRIFQVNDWIFLDPDSGIWWYKLSSKLYIKKKQIQWLINTVPHLSIKPYIPTRVTNCIFLKLSPTTFFWVKYKALCTQICRFASRNLWQVEVKPPSPPFEVPFEVGFWMGTFVTGTFNRTHFKGNQTSSTCMVVFKVPFPPRQNGRSWSHDHLLGPMFWGVLDQGAPATAWAETHTYDRGQMPKVVGVPRARWRPRL